jgi:hypothetical protein
VISLPPEIAPDPDNPHWITYFPTEHPPESPVAQESTPPSIKIASGNAYKVFCSIPSKLQKDTSKKEASKKSWWKNFVDWVRSFYIVKTVLNEMQFIFFVPGEYTIDVTAKYWISPKRPPDEDYHTTVASRTLTVDAPQTVILFGAMLGGLISYILFPQARRRLVASETSKEAPSISKKLVREFFGILGAVLLSAIVTILLARISETQFLIKVTVTDLWGAVAIGFVANYAGAEIINKIIKRYKDEQRSQTASSEQKKENVNRNDS